MTAPPGVPVTTGAHPGAAMLAVAAAAQGVAAPVVGTAVGVANSSPAPAQTRTGPFRPRRFAVYRLGPATKTRTRAGREVKCWDVLWAVDSRRFRRRFTTVTGGRTAATAYAQSLRAGFADPNKLWSHHFRTFLDPAPALATVSVAAWLLTFWDARSVTWSPGTRQVGAAALRRAVAGFATETPSEQVLVDLDDNLRPSPGRTVGPALTAFLVASSLPVSSVNAAAAQMLMTAHSVNVSFPATQRRWTSVLSAAFAAAVDAGLCTSDPFASLVYTRRRTVGAPTAGGVLDSDRVPSPAQVVVLADAVGRRRAGYRMLVLLMGLCGLRFSEARSVRGADVAADAAGRVWVKVGRSARLVSPRWLDPGDDPCHGPLKGRDPKGRWWPAGWAGVSQPPPGHTCPIGCSATDPIPRPPAAGRMAPGA